MEKEIYISLSDFLLRIQRCLIKSQVSSEHLILYSDVVKAAKESKRIEA